MSNMKQYCHYNTHLILLFPQWYYFFIPFFHIFYRSIVDFLSRRKMRTMYTPHAHGAPIESPRDKHLAPGGVLINTSGMQYPWYAAPGGWVLNQLPAPASQLLRQHCITITGQPTGTWE